MSDKIVLLGSGTLTNTPGTVLYTNVSGEEAVVMQIDLQNSSGSTVTAINVAAGTDATLANRIFHSGTQLTTLQKSQQFYSPGHPLTGTSTINGSAGTTAVINFAIWGTRRLV